MQTKIRLTGTSPLIHHSNRLANPLDPTKAAIAGLTGKRKKTRADYLEIARLEFVAALYMGDDGPVIPPGNLRKLIIEGGRKDKNGKQFEAGVYIPEPAVLEYDGPRTPRELWEFTEDPTENPFVWMAIVGNQKSSVLRTRPRFQSWRCVFAVETDDELVDANMLRQAVKKAEKIGVGDARSMAMGRFHAEVAA